MILARLNGTVVYCEVTQCGRERRITIMVDRKPIAYAYKRHKVFWLTAVYEQAPDWAKPFLDRAHWGASTIDNLRITITTVLTRALLVHQGVKCTCGVPATGFRLDSDGTKAMVGETFEDREAIPQCLDCQYTPIAKAS